jgi:hypothetical protein
VQAKLAVLARTLAPELFADVMTLINQVLPGPAPGGDEARRGRDSESDWAPSKWTDATYRAAEANNEL